MKELIRMYSDCCLVCRTAIHIWCILYRPKYQTTGYNHFTQDYYLCAYVAASQEFWWVAHDKTHMKILHHCNILDLWWNNGSGTKTMHTQWYYYKQTLQMISAIEIENNLRGSDMRVGFIRGWGCKCHET